MFKSSSERTKKVYPDWSSKPVNVYACMNMSFEAFFYEKKRMVLSQNKWPTICPTPPPLPPPALADFRVGKSL